MRIGVTLILAVVLLAFLGCNSENPISTSTDQDQAAFDQQGKPKPPRDRDPKDCTECDANSNIVCTSSKTLSNGATVTWTSSFGGFDYAGGDYTVTVSWSVVDGSATFTGFDAKKKTWTPKGVGGTWSTASSTSLNLTVNMDPMHRAIDVDPAWEGYIGNGHFKLELDVDGVKAKLGVNVHLENPDDGFGARCP